MTRRRLLASKTLTPGVVCFAPHHLFAAPESSVETIRASAASSKITLQNLRGNVSILMGAGGNIAVLPGRDGKLLVDAGYVGSRPRISDALATISSDLLVDLQIRLAMLARLEEFDCEAFPLGCWVKLLLALQQGGMLVVGCGNGAVAALLN